MSTTVTRESFTPEEIRLLRSDPFVREGCVECLIQLVINVGGGTVLGMMGAAAAGWALGLLGVPHLVIRILLAIGTFGGLALGSWSYAHRDDWITTEVQRRRAMLERGEAEVIRADVAGAVRVAEWDDESPGYFLDVGEGQLLFLLGPYLDEPVEREEFPSTRLEVRRAGPEGWVFGVRCLGDHFPPQIEHPASAARLPWIPADGEIIFATLETLEADLKRILLERGRR